MKLRPRTRDLWGAVVHTTGRTVARAAERAGEPVKDRLWRLYMGGPAFPHYVILGDGELLHIADEGMRGAHAGIPSSEWWAYRSGQWRRRLSGEAVKRWDEDWEPEGKQSPCDLFPGRSPNSVYLGIELVPRLDAGKDEDWYTDAQYLALNHLLAGIAQRHGLDWDEPGRLVGHEDLEPLTRSDARGGWDPGATRLHPRFDWARVG